MLYHPHTLTVTAMSFPIKMCFHVTPDYLIDFSFRFYDVMLDLSYITDSSNDSFEACNR